MISMSITVAIKRLFIAVFILSSAVTFGQKHSLGKVSIDELKQKAHPTDTSAAAAVLFKKSILSFSISGHGYWLVTVETDVRIKIYSTEGYNYANVEQSFYQGVHDEKVTFSEAVTYNLVDGKIEKTKLKGEGEFVEKPNKNIKVKKITLPNVREGSIIEYRTVFQTYNVSELPDFFFQQEIPVEYVEYQVTTPQFFVYNKVLGGTLSPKRVDTNVKRINEYNELRSNFVLEKVPALVDEAYVSNINNFRSRLCYELATKIDQSGRKTEVASSWEAVSKQIYDHDSFGRELDRSNYFKDDLATVLVGANTKIEKINLIFEFVQKKMTWNHYLGYHCNQGVIEAYKNASGNVAEINLMLTAMLRSAGLEANPVLVSTRANGITLYPSRTGYNYVIASAMSDEGLILLDATSKVNRPGILPHRAINWIGRMLKPNHTTQLVGIEPKFKSIEAVTLAATVDQSGKISGKIRNYMTDYTAFSFREQYLNLNETAYIEMLERKNSGIEIGEYTITNQRDFMLPVVEEYNFETNNAVDIIGDKIYVSPMMFLRYGRNPFKQEDRSYPVDFIFPKQEKYSITINLPEGYTIESMPASASFGIEDNIGTFKYIIAQTGNQIQLSASLDLNVAVVQQQHYHGLQSLFNQMIAKQNEKIVLKRI